MNNHNLSPSMNSMPFPLNKKGLDMIAHNIYTVEPLFSGQNEIPAIIEGWPYLRGFI